MMSRSNATVSKSCSLLLTLWLAACGAPIKLINSPQVPAAQGELSAKVGDNGNTRLKLSVKHLAPPEKVAPGAAVFVVWATGPGPESTPQNLGALQVNGNLEGRLETVTPLRTFSLMITAEPSATAAAPSGPPVLSASVVAR